MKIAWEKKENKIYDKILVLYDEIRDKDKRGIDSSVERIKLDSLKQKLRKLIDRRPYKEY